MRRGKLFILLIAVAAFTPAAVFAGTTDIFGGTASRTDDDIFSRAMAPNSWAVRVRSFAYAQGDTLPPNLPADGAPGPGETLFLYLVENIGGTPSDPNDPGLTDTAVVTYQVANPEPAPILAIGKASSVSVVNPADMSVTGIREDPRTTVVQPLSCDYNWITQTFPPPPTDVLHPNEWSVVYFRAAATWTGRNALVTGAGMTDGETVLGPIVPEPATVTLLALGLMLLRRRAD